jgi:MFS family permease
LGVFFGFITLYTLISWVPSFARSAGMPIALAIYAGTVLNLGAFAGSASIGALSVWMPLRKLITLFMFAAVAVMQVYGKAALPTPLLFLAIFLIGLLVQGGFNGYYPAAARIYPAQLRATGIGFAMGAGRTGAILGPLAAGYLTDAGVTMSTMFIVFSVPLAISGIAAFIIPSANLRR